MLCDTVRHNLKSATRPLVTLPRVQQGHTVWHVTTSTAHTLNNKQYCDSDRRAIKINRVVLGGVTPPAMAANTQ
jgi:hypothetical protein